MGKKAKNKIRIRDLRSGDWFWIQREVIRKYSKKIGAAGILVYNLLACLADEGQSCFPSQKYIASSLGYSRPYINEVLRRLEENGLIKIEKKGRYHRTYYLLKMRCKVRRTQVSTTANSGVKYSDTNNNTLPKNINNNVGGNKNFLNFNSFKGFEPKTRKELLAVDLVRELNDEKSLPLYLYYTKKYPEPVIRKILGEVKETPPERIKKSKAALFNYLIKKYAQSKATG